jgi:uncharacterized protein (TIGR02266 family)
MTSSSTTRKTVLVAANTPFVRDRFKTALDAAGHRTMVVKSVAQLLAHVRADFDDLDLIVMDLRMPHGDGIALVQRIRKLDDGRLPILVFTGSVGGVEEVRELAALALNLSRGGMAVRIAKPPTRGTAVKVKFALPGSKREMEAEGVVCWSDQKARMGIRFTKVKLPDQAVVDAFVEAHFFRSVKMDAKEPSTK